jgi:TolB-like protein/DNA-binding winged helix-turn-helix (wHTH) protein/tetratricopeptide (TPR) repeat protein
MLADNSQGTTLGIGDVEIDTARREVRRGPRVIRLPKLSYRMLLELAAAAPAVLTHDELIERVWDGRVVSPETVTQRVKLLRAALGDDANQPRYIALVRGEGYRLIPDVVRPMSNEVEHAPAAVSARSWAVSVLVSSVAAVIVAAGFWFVLVPGSQPDSLSAPGLDRPISPNSIAVLPFAYVGLDPGETYISDGMARTLIDQLSHVDKLNVIAWTSSAVFRDRGLDTRTVAAQLGVETLVEGTFEQDGDTFRIAASIVDGESGFQRWSETFHGDRSALPVLQREIARRIITQLAPSYEGRAASRGSGSLDPTAYDLMLLARARYEDVRDQPIVDYARLDEAIDLYRQLTELEPDSVQAWSRLAAALLYKGDVLGAAGPINRAIAIDPDSAEALYTLGLYKWRRYEDGSGAAFDRAITLNPNHAGAQEAYAKYLWHQLVSDVPEEHFLRALEFDTQRLTRYSDLGTFYGMSGRQEKARNIAGLIAERFEGATAWMSVARTLELIGDLDEAIGWALRAHAAEPDRAETAWMVAELYARIGDFETARRYEPGPAFNLLYWERRYDEMIELGDELIFDQPGQPQIWYGMGRAFAATGRYDRAIDYLLRQNVPARAMSENRRANDEEALISLAGALKASGNVERAREFAGWFRPYLITMLETGAENAWWPHLYLACVDSILDDQTGALERLERLQHTHGMPWYPLLVDAPCFRELSESSVYQAALRSVEEKQAALRLRLPDTLARLEREWNSGTLPSAAIRTSD